MFYMKWMKMKPPFISISAVNIEINCCFFSLSSFPQREYQSTNYPVNWKLWCTVNRKPLSVSWLLRQIYTETFWRYSVFIFIRWSTNLGVNLSKAKTFQPLTKRHNKNLIFIRFYLFVFRKLRKVNGDLCFYIFIIFQGNE